jgi:hypothetical protein
MRGSCRACSAYDSDYTQRREHWFDVFMAMNSQIESDS